MNVKKFIVEFDHRRLTGFLKRISKMTVRRKKLNRWKQVMNSFTWTSRYLLGVELHYPICSQGSLQRIFKFARFVGFPSKIKLIEYLCILFMKTCFVLGKKSFTQCLKVFRKREEDRPTYIYIVFSL
jgi:hypothetical protein